MITAKKLKDILTYFPETGDFYWKMGGRGIKPDRRAGSLNFDGYMKIGINYKLYSRSRLAFLFMKGRWPKNEIDHIDGNPSNDKWTNLREATHLQNGKNKRIPKHNKSGFKGVRWHKKNKKWEAAIVVNGRKIYLGQADEINLAGEMYKKAAIEYFGEYVRVL